MKRTGYSCIEPRERGIINPVRIIKRWKRNMKNAYQRIRYGYCEKDVWSIDWWFLNVVPNMLEDLKKTAHGYPNSPEDVSQALVGTGNIEKIDEKEMQQWQDILSEMIFLFREANGETCTRKNKYEEKHQAASDEFQKKYGYFGDGLKTEEEKEIEKKNGSYRWYMLGDVPEYKEISDLYIAEEREIEKYRNECKDKGIEMFKTWFWQLWD